jgi:hypothetical protein
MRTGRIMAIANYETNPGHLRSGPQLVLSPLNGFVILAFALFGLLSSPVQIRRMNFSKEWPKVVLEVAVVLFLVVVGIAMISKNRDQ